MDMQPTLFDTEEYTEEDTTPCWVVNPRYEAASQSADDEAYELYLDVCGKLERAASSRNRWRKWALIEGAIICTWLILKTMALLG